MADQTEQNGPAGEDRAHPATVSGDDQQSSPKPRTKKRRTKNAAPAPSTDQLSRDLADLRTEVERVWHDLSRAGAVLKAVAQSQGVALNAHARKAVHDQPVKTLAGTFGAGLVFGLLMASRPSRHHNRRTLG